MAITWRVAEANENGTLLEFKEDDHKVWIRMSEKFTSKDTIGILDYEDIHKYLIIMKKPMLYNNLIELSIKII